jgi:protein farnesyltransferase/geranylgeranyltransferase type-1 subunit alpha
VPAKLPGDPEWDDVVPVVLEEPEGALAAIAYPAEYAEGEVFLLSLFPWFSQGGGG